VQLEILKRFTYSHELENVPNERANFKNEYYFNNGSFCFSDAEYLYNIIRLFKPNRIIEIGCGYSTLLISNALEKNNKELPFKYAEHICIEPYEHSWLNDIKVKLIRKRIEEVNLDFFRTLGSNDILFIDSSHIIRAQGDVLYEYLEILPILNKGVTNISHFKLTNSNCGI